MPCEPLIGLAAILCTLMTCAAGAFGYFIGMIDGEVIAVERVPARRGHQMNDDDTYEQQFYARVEPSVLKALMECADALRGLDRVLPETWNRRQRALDGLDAARKAASA